jgi:hypothetical protein
MATNLVEGMVENNDYGYEVLRRVQEETQEEMPLKSYKSVEVNDKTVGYVYRYEWGGYAGFTFNADEFFQTEAFKTLKMAVAFVLEKSQEEQKDTDSGIKLEIYRRRRK